MRRTVRHLAYFHVPWGTPEERIPFNRFLRTYIERKEREGWRLERVLRVWPTDGVVLDPKGAMREYNVETLLSRPVQTRTLDVPDAVAARLTTKYPNRFKLIE